MNKLLIAFLFSLICVKLFAQINMADSTVQVIGYWDIKEKQSYNILQKKFKIQDADTTFTEYFKYSVDITIADSTTNSYLIDWYFHDYEVEEGNELIKKLLTIPEDMTIRIKTDQFGTFQEVINWKEVQGYIFKVTELLQEETNTIPDMKTLINQIEQMYSSRESIESSTINEIQQFFTFHGGIYKLGEEYKTEVKLPNLYGGEPFDTKLTVWLDELNPENSTFVIRIHQSVDSEQLTGAAFDYLTKMSDRMKLTAPEKEKFPLFTNNTWTSSRIHESGWIIYSIETKEVKSEGITNIEERIIEIQ